MGAETVDLGPDQPRTILTWDGYHTYLEHTIKANPDEAYTNLVAIINYFNIPLPMPLMRQDLPQQADPNSSARQQQIDESLRQQVELLDYAQIDREEESFAQQTRLEEMRRAHAMTAISNTI